MDPLLPSFRRELRARAHALDPVVSIGQHGLTDAVLHEIDVALKAHELIKVRIFNDDRLAREAMLARICDALACAPVQQIGKLLVLWRPRPSGEPNEARPAARDARHGREKPDASGARRRRRAASVHPMTPVGKTRSRAPAATAEATRKSRPAPASLGGANRASRPGAKPPAGVPRAGQRRRRRAR
jgi:RNA-binding protein